MLTTMERQIIVPSLGTVVGKMVFEMVKDIKVVFGKGSGSRSVQSEDERAPMWKNKSIFLGVILLKSLRGPPRN